jgi:hypothetical protein
VKETVGASADTVALVKTDRVYPPRSKCATNRGVQFSCFRTTQAAAETDKQKNGGADKKQAAER